MENLHHFGVSKLYRGPRMATIRPRMIKCAAIKGVGEMIVVTVLRNGKVRGWPTWEYIANLT